MACDVDFQTNQWGRCPDSRKIAAISAFLNQTAEATVQNINAIKVPTSQQLQEDWFRDSMSLYKSDIAQSIVATAQFLVKIRGGEAAEDYSKAVNRSYLIAAIDYPNQVDIDKIIETSTRKAGVLQYSWADSGCSEKQGLAAMGELLSMERRIDAVIGPACSSACEVTSFLAVSVK